MDTTSASHATIESPSWHKWIEPWYLAYALLGITAAGLAPILLPLQVSRTGSAADTGWVIALFSLGGLTAPLWGGLADRLRLHRVLLVGGLVITGLSLTAFPFTTNLIAWLVLALLMSIGIAGTATVANLFVVEAHPKAEWDERIGWLQTFYGGGQVGGLLLAGVLSQIDLRIALLAAAGLTVLAVVPGWLTTHTPPAPLALKPVLLHPARHSEWALASPQRLFHHLNAETWRDLRPALNSPFGIFLVVWMLTFTGAATVFALYPVLMQQAYGITPSVSSIGFAVGAGLGLALYTPAGHWSERAGAARVLQVGLGVRLIAFLVLLSLGFMHIGISGGLALVAFAFVVLAWSLLSVSGTALAAQLSPVGEGTAMGIFNASTALAGVVGAALAGWVAQALSYRAMAGLAVIGVGVGLLLALVQPPPHDK